jgi:hypothetical protein
MALGLVPSLTVSVAALPTVLKLYFSLLPEARAAAAFVLKAKDRGALNRFLVM